MVVHHCIVHDRIQGKCIAYPSVSGTHGVCGHGGEEVPFLKLPDVGGFNGRKFELDAVLWTQWISIRTTYCRSFCGNPPEVEIMNIYQYRGHRLVYFWLTEMWVDSNGDGGHGKRRLNPADNQWALE